jgi:hypothetical protein
MQDDEINSLLTSAQHFLWKEQQILTASPTTRMTAIFIAILVL